MSSDMESRMQDQIEGAQKSYQDMVDISNIPEVHEALFNFSHDSTQDNACYLIAAILNRPNLCEGCPPAGYPTDETRCSDCPLHSANQTTNQ